MKLVVNKCYGGFSIKREVAKLYGFDSYRVKRNNPWLIGLVEGGYDCEGDHSKLVVVTIPSAATDYEIIDYDGFESVIYVLNGKIHYT